MAELRDLGLLGDLMPAGGSLTETRGLLASDDEAIARLQLESLMRAPKPVATIPGLLNKAGPQMLGAVGDLRELGETVRGALPNQTQNLLLAAQMPSYLATGTVGGPNANAPTSQEMADVAGVDIDNAEGMVAGLLSPDPFSDIATVGKGIGKFATVLTPGLIKSAKKQGGDTLRLTNQPRVTVPSTALRRGEARMISNIHGFNRGDQRMARDAVRAYRTRHPESDGWAPVEMKTVEKKQGKKGPTYLPKPKPQNYRFARDSQGNQLKGRAKTVRKNRIVKGLISEFEDIRDRAIAGDYNANSIIRQVDWYRGMRTELRRTFGGLGDTFADLLAATSPGEKAKANYEMAADLLDRFSKGDFKKELTALSEHLDSGGLMKDYAGPIIRKRNGKLYGKATDASMLALLNLWRLQGDAPKTRNFAGNLIGITDEATIDLWAARSLDRLAGKPRIPPSAEKAVQGTLSKVDRKPTGDFGFAQEVLRDAAQEIGTEPDELQAMLWFAEKERWVDNGWATLDKGGGSFNDELRKEMLEHAFIGLSPDNVPGDTALSEVEAMTSRLHTKFSNQEGVRAIKAEPSFGMYVTDKENLENSIDLEMVTTPDFDARPLLAEVANEAKGAGQDMAMVSRTLTNARDAANARPGLSMFFNEPITQDRAQDFVDMLRAKGVDGFTLVQDPRGGIVGIRHQWVPEIEVMYKGLDPADLASARRAYGKKLNELTDQFSALPDVSYVQRQYYDTVVMTGENYDGFNIGNAAGARGSNSRKWPRRSLSESVRSATGRP